MRSFSHVTLIVIASLTVWCSLLTQAAPAQTFTVVHEFSGGCDGASPVGGLAMDRAGNSYGATLVGGGGPCSFNGTTGCGVIFALKRSGSGWTVSPLYDFAGGNDGYGPGPLVIGTNGSLYGATSGGGGLGDCAENGCGTVYNVKPPAASCKTALCLWNESILYRFAGSDGVGPNAPLIFDSAGKLYGSTYLGGAHNGGTVFRLTPSSGLWSESLLYSFTGGNDGYLPSSGLTFDRTGNLYGTTYYGGTGIYGTVFELTPSGSGWTESVLHNFQAQISTARPAEALRLCSN